MQNTKLIKKISTSLVSTGEIIDSLQSNSSTSAPSIRAVVDNMTPPMNLLINGDFKVNQRGKSSYIGGGGKYGLDGWYQYQTTLTVTDSGITLTSSEEDNNLMQILPINLLNKTLTFVTKIDGVVHSKTFVLTQSVDTYSNEKFNIKAYSDSSNRLRFIVNIVNSSTINIEYIDLFEGSIAYSHIAEDDAIALMRCMAEIEIGEYPVYYDGKTYFMSGFQFKTKKNQNPTVQIISAKNGNNQNLENLVAVVTNKDGVMLIRKSSGTMVGTVPDPYIIKALISCEPL